jgi:hypothetical protein
MHYLVFIDDLRHDAVWVVLVFVAFIGGFIIRVPRMNRGWKRNALRTVGALFLGLAVILAVPLAFFSFTEPRTQHFVFSSSDGSRVALLSHDETRDSAAAEVTVKGTGCCSRFVAYRYYGDGEDYTGAGSLQWVDDHHLVIRFVRDPSGEQICQPKVGDVTVICFPRPGP